MIADLSQRGRSGMRHPHADAAYRVIRRDDGAFAVEVTIPDTNPTTVSAFASEAAAQEWIARHRDRVQQEPLTVRRFRRSGSQPK
jgi:hypothetical protein